MTAYPQPIHRGYGHHYRRRLPVWQELLLHLLAIAIGLLLFALPHHVISYRKTGTGIETVRGGYAVRTAPIETVEGTASEAPEAADAAAEAAEVAEAPTAEAELPETTRVGDFSERFSGRFTDGEIIRTDSSYRSKDLCITIEDLREEGVDYHVADIYVRDISCLRRVLGKDTYGKHMTESIESVTERTGAILTMNGDYYSNRDSGVVQANGMLYLDGEIHNDICVLYWDGSLKCFPMEGFDCSREIDNDAYQIWNFGPALLDDQGYPLESFPERYDDIKGHNPRSVLGYYEPGHYCLIAVDGRSSSSKGMTLKALSELVYTLGLTQAYNLDGGKTSQLYFGSTPVNVPAGGGRDCSDYICILDTVTP